MGCISPTELEIVSVYTHLVQPPVIGVGGFQTVRRLEVKVKTVRARGMVELLRVCPHNVYCTTSELQLVGQVRRTDFGGGAG